MGTLNYSSHAVAPRNNDSGYVDFEIDYGNGSSYGVDPGDTGDNTGSMSPALLKQSPPVIALFTVAYGIVLILAVVNNSLVVTAIQRNQQLRTVTNMFITNLAVADITVSLLVLPITLLNNLFTEWQFGAFLCRAIPYLQAVAVGASSNTLVAVAIERYLAIFYAGTVTIGPNQVVLIITVIWMVPACVQIPWAVFSKQEVFLTDVASGTTGVFCYQDWPSKEFEKAFFLGVVFLTCYLIPLCFLAVFYGLIGVKVWKRTVAGIQGSRADKSIQRSKIRIVRMLVVVTTTFALSWLPLYSLGVYTLVGPKLEVAQMLLLRDTIGPIAQWLGSANSCVNPFVYCYFSEHFRKAITGIFSGCWCCRRLGQEHGSPRTQSTRVVVVEGEDCTTAKKPSVVVADHCPNGSSKQV